MSTLFGLLDLGAGALAAQNAGVAVSGRNTANVGTEGYSRESVDLRSELAAPLVGGVRAFGPRRAEDLLLAARERLAAGEFGRADASASALSDLEAGLTSSGNDLVSAIAELFGGFVRLAGAPLDPAVRAETVADAQSLAAAVQRSAQTIAQARRDADARTAAQADEATRLAAEIAAANRAIAGGATDPTLADKRDLAARQLAEAVGGQARIDSDGQLRFVLDGGQVLVDGGRAASLRAVPDAAYDGYARIDVVDGAHVADVTAAVGGRMGGELAVRDGTAAQAAADLDALAYDLATQVNAVHQAGAGLDGVSGRGLFVAPTGVAGAAASLAVDPALAADPSRLAAGAAGAGLADNSNALALADLASARAAGGGARTFTDEGIRALGAVGSAARTAASDRDLASARADAAAAARDALSGVSLDEEMTKLAEFRHASEAAARFVSVVDDLLGRLIEEL